MRPAPTSCVLLLVLGLTGACKKDDITWVQANKDRDQTLVVRVADDCGDDAGPATLRLQSSLGITDVGQAEVDPGCGPVGTSHLVSVILNEGFEAIVGRVTVEVQTDAVADLDGDGDRDNRGEGEYELQQDSFDPGAWAITLQSLGADGEQREDRFTFRLWQPEQLAPELDGE